MTKIITTIVLTIFSIAISWAQNPFEKLVGNEHITSVVVNKKMFELMGRVKMDAKDKKIGRAHV